MVLKQDKVFYSNVAPGDPQNEITQKFPAKIIFASETNIPYGGVYVRVYNETGVIIFKLLCEKPWLFLKLPEGDYNLVGVDRNKLTERTSFHVESEESGRQKRVTLKWPKSAVGY